MNDNQLLFQERKKIGENILAFIRDEGYTKSGFSKAANISRPTLDKLIEGDIDNVKTYSTHIRKIIEALSLDYDTLLNYQGRSKIKHKPELHYVHSNTSPDDHVMSQQAEEVFALLNDVIHLYELYQ